MKSNYFNSFIIHNNLSDLKFSGPPFTWCNNQRGDSRIWARLDRVLTNDKWLDDASFHHVSHLARCQSDHSPILIKCWKQMYHKKRPFRFDNNWIHLHECHKSVEEIWKTEISGNPMHTTSHRLHNLKNDLTKKCMGHSGKLETKIKQIEEQITQIESRECTNTTNRDIWKTLRPLYMRHQAYLRQHTTYWAQKSRLQWMQNGDCNTKYFHQATKNHRNNNRILHIKDKVGNILTDPSEIEATFIQHYTDLWASSQHTSDFSIFDSLPDDLPLLTQEQGLELTKPITRTEIFQTMKTMPRGKAPGPNGLNIEFFRAFWNYIGNDLIKAINYFFSHGKMAHSWNQTHICPDPKE
ncbi:hypothetical protein J5N97_011968 [Dioscorea zingiberensis]|uniref:Reverse transcriptase n=1 Tax=Dioscorea zingiberensis TaxID=325984 RepID=A0A9D5D254_9LILI|nr:hypothetical protein J5N97_011968 [Dioscorea zingiberensis]